MKLSVSGIWVIPFYVPMSFEIEYEPTAAMWLLIEHNAQYDTNCYVWVRDELFDKWWVELYELLLIKMWIDYVIMRKIVLLSRCLTYEYDYLNCIHNYGLVLSTVYTGDLHEFSYTRLCRTIIDFPV